MMRAQLRARRMMRWGCAAVAVAVGCSDLPSDPNAVFSLSFDALPFPAVVAGDTLRDSAGSAAPARAHAYNAKGVELVDAPIRYYTLDAGVVVDSVTGAIVAEDATGATPRIVAIAGGLQSPLLQLAVVPQPDLLEPADTILTHRFSFQDSVSSGPTLTARLRHAAGIPEAVRSYVVTFRILYPADTLAAYLTDESGKRSWADTTGTDGVAGRRVAIRPARLASADDSVVVEARARYRGMDVSGSPVRLVLRLTAIFP